MHQPIGILNEEKLKTDRRMSFMIKNLGLSTRTSYALQNNGNIYLGDLIVMSEANLLRVPNLGRKSLSEVKEFLSELALSLNTRFSPSLAEEHDHLNPNFAAIQAILAETHPVTLEDLKFFTRQESAVLGTPLNQSLNSLMPADQAETLRQEGIVYKTGADSLAQAGKEITSRLQETLTASSPEASPLERAIAQVRQDAVTSFDDTITKFVAILSSPDPEARKNLEAAISNIAKGRGGPGEA